MTNMDRLADIVARLPEAERVDVTPQVTFSWAIGAGPRPRETSSTERLPERADLGPSVPSVSVTGLAPGRVTATVTTAFPAWMHCTPPGQRLSDTTVVKVTDRPAPATEADSPTFTEKVSPKATLRTFGAVVVGAVVGGAVVVAAVVTLALVAGVPSEVDEPPPPHAAVTASRAPVTQAAANRPAVVGAPSISP
jgi:hypothetical protein